MPQGDQKKLQALKQVLRFRAHQAAHKMAMQQDQLIDRLAVQGFQRGTIRMAAGFRQCQVTEILQIQQAGFAIEVMQCRNGDAGTLQVREHIGKR